MESHDSQLKEAIGAFNRGDYFAAGEQFENTANRSVELKALTAALNRIAAALHMRFARGARQGAINLLSQAMLSLDDLRPAHGGIDTELLYQEVSAFVEDLRASPREQELGALRHRARLFMERRRAPKIILLER